MSTKNISWKQFLNTAIVAAVVVAPFAGAVSVAQAAPLPSVSALIHGNNGRFEANRRNDHRRRGNRRRGNRGNKGRKNVPWNQHRDFKTFTGVVTNAKSGSEFNVRIDGKIYNVYLDARRPRGLNKNDVVRVYGKRVGANDIRNANVTILRRR